MSVAAFPPAAPRSLNVISCCHKLLAVTKFCNFFPVSADFSFHPDFSFFFIFCYIHRLLICFFKAIQRLQVDFFLPVSQDFCYFQDFSGLISQTAEMYNDIQTGGDLSLNCRKGKIHSHQYHRFQTA